MRRPCLCGEQVGLWKLPTPDPNREPVQEHAVGGENGTPLAPLGEPQTQFGGLETAASAMLWSPPGASMSEGEGIVTLADGKMKQWRIGDGT